MIKKIQSHELQDVYEIGDFASITINKFIINNNYPSGYINTMINDKRLKKVIGDIFQLKQDVVLKGSYGVEDITHKAGTLHYHGKIIYPTKTPQNYYVYFKARHITPEEFQKVQECILILKGDS